MRVKISLFSVVSAVVLSMVAVATLYPFIYMISVSLSSSVYVLRNEVSFYPRGINLDMYRMVLKDPRIWQSYMNTIIYTGLGTLISLVITSMGAYALAKKEMVFRKAFTLMIVFTMFFGGGMIPTFLVVKNLGLIDTVWGMVLPGAVSTWNLLVMRTFFSAMPVELEESGRLDGLTDFGIFMRIIIPLSKAVFATIGLFYAVAMWNNFYLPLLYLRDANLFPLQVVLRNMIMAGTEASNAGGENFIVDESLKYAVIMVATVPILIVYPFLQKYFSKGVMIGAVKG
ncbi:MULTISPECIES: carbohydrate ABC transporter permease [Paenibacillus]|uniref:Carbohydrate ABC transporter permease n=1 Tax=Paenibacillus baimaensis TaxID=2982185 RepID=A0ABT2UC29_9BACL|nr:MULTISPECIES: carbohydrate ABC transporter permease [unclassified Paenibacillus]MCU6792160.1 carbohydrate ABC transporter permease [Paenibacillus sp. WQ 127069]OMF01081.1 sugar ABC transporter permease [Paenibacillus sp. FSL H7-0331]